VRRPLDSLLTDFVGPNTNGFVEFKRLDDGFDFFHF
jgi:hypothetical protein